MKSETYIVPAIKYYLVKLTEEAEEYIKNVGEDLEEYSDHKLLKKGTYFIPFKEVEGLTVGEIAQLLEVNNYFIVIARTEIDACSVISDYYFKTGYNLE